MSIFEDALASARAAVTTTYGVPATITAMIVSDYKGSTADPDRLPLTIPGILHEFPSGKSRGADGEARLIERSDGGRPGASFGVDLAARPIRISFDVVDLGGWIPPAGTVITIAGRSFEVIHPAPQNGGRIFLFVTEVAS